MYRQQIESQTLLKIPKLKPCGTVDNMCIKTNRHTTTEKPYVSHWGCGSIISFFFVEILTQLLLALVSEKRNCPSSFQKRFDVPKWLHSALGALLEVLKQRRGQDILRLWRCLPFRWLFGGRLSSYTAVCWCAPSPPLPSRGGTSTPSVSVSPGQPELKCSS